MDKYIFGTEENKAFLKELREDLLSFGHRFPSPGGSSYYLDNCVVDHKRGSWFHQLDEHNKVIKTVWPGKSDIYHAIQATLIPYGEIDKSVIFSKKEY